MKIVLLDNFDSFTYNLVAQLRSMGYDVQVFRNDVRPEVIARHLLDEPENRLLVLSPGPGAPHEAGCMMKLLSMVAGQVPVLGICLGHQALVTHYGGIVSRAPGVVHGKSSQVFHNGRGVFRGLASPLTVARYHSLIATEVPASLQVIALTSDSLVMAVENVRERVIGFQFHPESILTTAGQSLLESTIDHLRVVTHESAVA